MLATDIVAELTDIVGPAHVLTDPDTTARYITDWTGRWHGTTTAVVRPADTEEVARVIGVCRRAGVGIVAQGGNTGLVGGSIPMHGEIVLSLARLDSIAGVDPIGHTLAAGAGVTVARAQAAARGAGLMFGVDLASSANSSSRSIACSVPRHDHPSQRFDNYRSTNALIESFWSRMQIELLDRKKWKTCTELANAIFDYIEVFHNRQRRRSGIGRFTPGEFDKASRHLRSVS